MKEDFLHFVWQYRLFDQQHLCTTESESIAILHTGNPNVHSGPDFQHAKIKLGKVEWHGHIEMHLRSSDWHRHGHQGDQAYENVILHVVWTDDKPVLDKDNQKIPTIELKDRVEEGIIFKYKSLVEGKEKIPCAQLIADVKPITILSQMDKASMQRLERKAAEVSQLLQSKKGDWEETTYTLICKNFGFKVNSEAFFTLAERLPFSIIRKERHRLLETEALLFGLAGFLHEEKPDDEYYQSLQRTYRYLAHKYQLTKQEMSATHWRFMRLRPPNFPTIRMAQLAKLLHTELALFSFFKESFSAEELIKMLRVQASIYWQNHYSFASEGKDKSARLGRASAENILINTLAPLLVAYGKFTDEQIYVDRAVALLEHLKAEKNGIIKKWNELQIHAKNALDSQALIEQYNEFCSQRKCLNCNIGASLMK